MGDFVGHIVSGTEVIAIDLDLHCTHATHATTAFVDVGFLDFRHGIELGPNLIGHLAGLAQTSLAAFSLGAKAQVERHDVRTIASHRGKGIVGVGLTEAVVTDLHFGDSHKVFSEALGKGASNVLSGTCRQFDVDAQTAFVQLRHHLSLQRRCKQDN